MLYVDFVFMVSFLRAQRRDDDRGGMFLVYLIARAMPHAILSVMYTIHIQQYVCTLIQVHDVRSTHCA